MKWILGVKRRVSHLVTNSSNTPTQIPTSLPTFVQNRVIEANDYSVVYPLPMEDKDFYAQLKGFICKNSAFVENFYRRIGVNTYTNDRGFGECIEACDNYEITHLLTPSVKLPCGVALFQDDLVISCTLYPLCEIQDSITVHSKAYFNPKIHKNYCEYFPKFKARGDEDKLRDLCMEHPKCGYYVNQDTNMGECTTKCKNVKNLYGTKYSEAGSKCAAIGECQLLFTNRGDNFNCVDT